MMICAGWMQVANEKPVSCSGQQQVDDGDAHILSRKEGLVVEMPFYFRIDAQILADGG